MSQAGPDDSVISRISRLAVERDPCSVVAGPRAERTTGRRESDGDPLGCHRPGRHRHRVRRRDAAGRGGHHHGCGLALGRTRRGLRRPLRHPDPLRRLRRRSRPTPTSMSSTWLRRTRVTRRTRSTSSGRASTSCARSPSRSTPGRRHGWRRRLAAGGCSSWRRSGAGSFPPTGSLVDVIGEGRIGDPLLVEADFGFRRPVDPEHRHFAPELGGGALLDLGIYPVQLCTLVLGPIERVVADGVVGETGRRRGGRCRVAPLGGRGWAWSRRPYGSA